MDKKSINQVNYRLAYVCLDLCCKIDYGDSPNPINQSIGLFEWDKINDCVEQKNSLF